MTINYENPGAMTGGTWATGAQVDVDANKNMALDASGRAVDNPMDVDGLEVWGADGPSGDDANRYSLEGDSVVDPTNSKRVPVFAYDSTTPVSTAFMYADELAAAVSALTGIELDTLVDGLDLDAMMTLGERILFSIDPISDGAVSLDGGEIFVWDRSVGGAAAYLHHGGHDWDTAFDVMGTYNTPTENVNALEAVSVPEPATVLMMAMGLAGIGYRRYKAL